MRENIGHWWDQAQRDLVSAGNSLQAGDYYVCAFLCQQAVEKGLKACIMKAKGSPPDRVHALVKLAETAGVPNDFRPFLRQLTSEYFLSRYPDAAEDAPHKLYNKKDAEGVLSGTQGVMQWLAAQMNR